MLRLVVRCIHPLSWAYFRLGGELSREVQTDCHVLPALFWVPAKRWVHFSCALVLHHDQATIKGFPGDNWLSDNLPCSSPCSYVILVPYRAPFFPVPHFLLSIFSSRCNFGFGKLFLVCIVMNWFFWDKLFLFVFSLPIASILCFFCFILVCLPASLFVSGRHFFWKYLLCTFHLSLHCQSPLLSGTYHTISF